MKLRTCLAFASIFSTAASAATFGDPDPTFPAMLAYESCSDAIGATGDSTLYVGGFSPLGVSKLRKDGSLETGWGDAGHSGALPQDGGLPVSPRGFLPTIDGGVIVVGTRLVKYNRAGVLDTAFGVGGVSDPIEYGGVIHSFALQDDGSVIVAAVSPTLRTAVFTRIAPNGRRATSFGGSGVIVIDLGDATAELFAWSVRDNVVEYGSFVRDGDGVPQLRLRFASASDRGLVKSSRLVPATGSANWMSPTVQVMPDGSVVLATRRCASSGCTSVVLRVRPDGSLDPAFGGNSGRVLPPVEIEGRLIATSPVMLTVAQGGSMTVVGKGSFTYGGFFGSSFESDHAFRLAPVGSLDASFPQGKTVGQQASRRYMQIDDGRLLSVGSSTQCPQRLTSDALRMNVRMAEYYNPRRQEFFITAEGRETGILDATTGPDRWERTGFTWGGWLAADLPGAKRVCRFAGGESHFWALEGPECELLRSIDAATPPGSPAWRFEGYAFSAAEPVNGTCPNNLTPIYRAYNRGFSQGITPKHRYSADERVYQSMIARGWAAEGVRFCVPPVSDPLSRP